MNDALSTPKYAPPHQCRVFTKYYNIFFYAQRWVTLDQYGK